MNLKVGVNEFRDEFYES